VKPVSFVTGRVAVLDRADVDTDQIIPKQFLKRIERTGWGDFLFFDWRLDEQGQPRPEFELNKPAFAGAKILLAGRNFGCGSSREHAAWALQDYGFQAVVAPSFGDIFRTNCGKIGLVAVALAENELRALMNAVDESSGSAMSIDLEAQELVAPGGRRIQFDFDPSLRHRLLNGLDDVGLALLHEDEIADFEARHPAAFDTATLV
jgi:3-isopropylmalate/(R)-2-methylmalate dehydratase small subunit